MISQERKEEILKGLKDGTILNEDTSITFDENGNWNRNYLDMSVPAKDLALPRNEVEEALFLERVERVTIPYFERRLLCKNPLPLQEMFESYDPDYDDPNSEIVLESFKKSKTPRPYDIYLYQWQNRDWTGGTIEEKIRPVVIWPGKDKQLVIEITSKSKDYRKYQILIKDWKEIGLNKKSWIRIDNFDELNFNYLRSRTYIAQITTKTINEILIKIEEFNENFEEDPWDLISWIKSNQVKMYTPNKISDKPLILESKELKGLSDITSFNLSYLLYTCEAKNNLGPILYLIRILTKDSTFMYIYYTVFKSGKSKFATIYIGPKFIGILPKGKIPHMSIQEAAIKIIIERLSKYHKVPIQSYNIYKFNETILKQIKENTTEKDILNKLDII